MQNFEIEGRKLEDVLIIRNKRFMDERGYFEEIMNLNSFKALNLEVDFVQTNHSLSVKGVLRGLHFQHTKPQGKLVRVLNGSIYDVAVDIRFESPSYGKYFGLELNDTNKTMLYIPGGFAHGFLTLSETVNVVYQTTDYFYPEFDSGIIWNDDSINIEWPFHLAGIDTPIVSKKDQQLSTLATISEMNI